MLALAVSEGVEIGVALATLALAATTVWLGIQTRTQAKATVKLAEIAERELDATTTPVVRVMRDEKPGQADITTVNKGGADESLTVRIENRGPPAAEIEWMKMVPGGEGQLSDPGIPTSPTLERDMEWDVDFHPSPDEKKGFEGGVAARIVITYEGVGSAVRYQTRTWVKRDLDADYERWVIVKEEPPQRFGEPARQNQDAPRLGDAR